MDTRTIEIVADEAIAAFIKLAKDAGFLSASYKELERYHEEAISMAVVAMGKIVISTPASRKAADEKEEAEHRLDLLNSVMFNAKDYLSDLSTTSLSNLEHAIKKAERLDNLETAIRKLEQHDDAQLSSYKEERG